MVNDQCKKYPLTLVVTALIIFLSLYPFGHIELAADVPLADKWTHMVMYAVLAFVVGWEHRRSHPSSLILLSLIFPIALGGLLEIVQNYCTTYRSGEWLDFVADAIGAFVGYVIAIIVRNCCTP